MRHERINLALEGRATSDGRLLKPGALEWPDRVPVTSMGPNDVNSRVGHADGFQRAEDGTISAIVHMDDGALLDRRSVQIAVTHTHATSDDESVFTIHSARLSAVHLSTSTNAWPDLDKRISAREVLAGLDEDELACAWSDFCRGKIPHKAVFVPTSVANEAFKAGWDAARAAGVQR